jgi:hypothetical protein
VRIERPKVSVTRAPEIVNPNPVDGGVPTKTPSLFHSIFFTGNLPLQRSHFLATLDYGSELRLHYVSQTGSHNGKIASGIACIVSGRRDLGEGIFQSIGAFIILSRFTSCLQ